MSRTQYRDKLLAFLETIRRPGTSGLIGDDDLLVASGLIDSLAVVEIIAWLESEAGVDFSETGVQPEQLRTVSSILELIERSGR